MKWILFLFIFLVWGFVLTHSKDTMEYVVLLGFTAYMTLATLLCYLVLNV